MECITLASNSLLINVVPEERRITAFAVVRWAVNLGFACGMAAGGLLAKRIMPISSLVMR